MCAADLSWVVEPLHIKLDMPIIEKILPRVTEATVVSVKEGRNKRNVIVLFSDFCYAGHGKNTPTAIALPTSQRNPHCRISEKGESRQAV
jgi:hypothetical protein